MKTTTVTAVLLLIVAGLSPAADPPNPALTKLNGVWVIKSIERDPPEKGKDEGKGLRCAIADGKVTITVPGEIKPAGGLSIQVDSTKKPSLITIKPDGEQQSLPAIYELDGNKLIVCWHAIEDTQPPTEFTSKPGSGQTIVILERERANGEKAK